MFTVRFISCQVLLNKVKLVSKLQTQLYFCTKLQREDYGTPTKLQVLF